MISYDADSILFAPLEVANTLDAYVKTMFS